MLYIWFAASFFRKVNKIVLATVVVLFIAWVFNPWVGILGITTLLAFFWLRHLKSQRHIRKKIRKKKEFIVAHYENVHENSGEKFYSFLYETAQSILHTHHTITITFMNYVVKLGLIIISLYFVWISDWISIIACIVLFILIRSFSSRQLRFHKYIFHTLEAGESRMDSFTEIIESYVIILRTKIVNED